MENKLKVGDRVRHLVANLGLGTIVGFRDLDYHACRVVWDFQIGNKSSDFPYHYSESNLVLVETGLDVMLRYVE